MATNNVSDINSATIDETFPVAGVDNDTQGFRDNFSIVKQSLTTAKNEITDLYQRTPKLNETNNFNGSNIEQVNLKAVTNSSNDIGTFTNTSAEINFENGHFQYVRIGEILDNNRNLINNIEIELAGWPENNLGKITIQIKSSDTNIKTVNWILTNGIIKVSENWPGSNFEVTEDDTIVEFWSYDGGNTVYANYVGRFGVL